MKIYNTLTRRKEEFMPLGKVVGTYSCGPTVYGYAHIGNMRTYIFMDELRRVLMYEGYKLKSVMNITDVGHLLSDADEGEDKMVKASKEQRKTPEEIASYYTDVFFKDMDALNILRPQLTPKATEHIPEMLDFVYGLCDKGFGYETSDGIYYDISKFDGYGKLSGIDLEEQMAGKRVEINGEKRHPADFALWKKAPKEHIMQWDSKWGKGFPGWHIECSAMSRKYLGDTFDIHTGGVDHIPIHHENEIAQSYGLTGKNPAKYWMHGEFMLVDGGKMSKKLGNTYTLSDLEKRGFSPMHFRYFCLNTHYRKKLNFTFEALEGAKTAYNRLKELLKKHKNSDSEADVQKIDGYKKQFEAEISDDLNIPAALGTLWNMMKEPYSKDYYKLALKMDEVFGLCLDKEIEDKAEGYLPEEIQELARKRWEAKQKKDFKAADDLREQIALAGYSVKDGKEGYSIEKIK